MRLCCPCASVAPCSSSRMSSVTRSAAGPSMARVISWQRCAAPPSCMPQRRSRPRWNFQRPESMRRHSMPQARAAARLPPVKMRKPMNCGIVCATSTSSTMAPTMTSSSTTSLPIVSDKTFKEMGHRRPCLLPSAAPHCNCLVVCSSTQKHDRPFL
uniref:Uncharacterized protein n=1 Tax=Spermophilus dauricus TaxID=99837 RepID=A0A8C9PDM4_SPEDA